MPDDANTVNAVAQPANNPFGARYYVKAALAAKFLGINTPALRRLADTNEIAVARTTGGHRKYLTKSVLEYAYRNDIKRQERDFNLSKPCPRRDDEKLLILYSSAIEMLTDMVEEMFVTNANFLSSQVLRDCMRDKGREVKRLHDELHMRLYHRIPPAQTPAVEAKPQSPAPRPAS